MTPSRQAAAPDVVGVGEAMVLMQAADLSADDRFEVHVAGAELNVCAAVARLGLAAGFASRIGADPHGERVRRAAEALGVGTSLLNTDPARRTGVFFKEIRADGARRVHYYRDGSAASAMDASDAAAILAAAPRAIVVSGITAALGDGPAELVGTLCRASGALVVLDPNLRPALPAPDLLPLLPHTGLLVLGQDESAALLGETDPGRVFAAAAEAGAGEVVLKGGPDGVWFAGPDGRPRHLPSAARAVRDPVGAGDAFLGGYLAARLSGGSPEGAATLGTLLAARVVEVPGDTAGLPPAAEARALLARPVTAPGTG
ncbi:sugar kinase [Streptosporangium fragile]|uniref:Sugar kinase n=1 Tax=Streptosporangium fragile TaxID=46186 RepID=A0ABN3VYV9_9ACTN